VNRLAGTAMVPVAGMAVLGMTPTLAGAQTHPATYTLDDDDLYSKMMIFVQCCRCVLRSATKQADRGRPVSRSITSVLTTVYWPFTFKRKSNE
jgi:hypothetical protein